VGRLSRHRLSPACRRRSRSRAATCARSTATFPSCTTPSSRSARTAPSSTARSSSRRRRPRLRRLQQRLHPAASRVAKLAVATPASFVAFDLLAAGGKSLIDETQEARRAALERLLAKRSRRCYLTPMTRDSAVAAAWLREFEGAGLDGVIAKPPDAPYQPGKRAMLKIKHVRTADCVVAGFRWHKSTEEGGPRRSARSCSASTTTPASSITSA
jgi:hypothetical protein